MVRDENQPKGAAGGRLSVYGGLGRQVCYDHFSVRMHKVKVYFAKMNK